MALLELEVTGEVWHWRGPAPHHFLRVPRDDAELVRELAGQVTYGWGMIPVTAVVGRTRFTTAMIPKDDGYALPLKLVVRRAEGLDVGDVVTAHITVG